MSKICVHQYLKICNTNKQPPGIADFLRGTKTLYLLSKRYNYKLLIDYDIHPIFKFLKYDDNYYIKDLKENTRELIPPKNYNKIYNILKSLFESGNNIYTLTNSFHNKPRTNDNYNNHEINEANNYLKNILQPNNLLSITIKKRLKKMNIDINNKNDKYIVIHLRFNDNCLLKNNYSLKKDNKKKLYNIINDVKNNNKNKKIVIISNYYKLIEELKKKYDNIYFNTNNPVHLGSLEQVVGDEDLEEVSLVDECDNVEYKLLSKLDKKVRDTLTDLFILINSSKIILISEYGNSGFSSEIANIYNIPYKNLSSKVF